MTAEKTRERGSAARPYRLAETCPHPPTKIDIKQWEGPGGGWHVMCRWCWTEGEPKASALSAINSFEKAVKQHKRIAGKRDGRTYA